MRAELLQWQGVKDVEYHPREDYFTVRFDPDMVSLETVFATVVKAGKQMGREYSPEVVSNQ